MLTQHGKQNNDNKSQVNLKGASMTENLEAGNAIIKELQKGATEQEAIRLKNVMKETHAKKMNQSEGDASGGAAQSNSEPAIDLS